jgi:hypothetical protein
VQRSPSSGQLVRALLYSTWQLFGGFSSINMCSFSDWKLVEKFCVKVLRQWLYERTYNCFVCVVDPAGAKCCCCCCGSSPDHSWCCNWDRTGPSWLWLPFRSGHRHSDNVDSVWRVEIPVLLCKSCGAAHLTVVRV